MGIFSATAVDALVSGRQRGVAAVLLRGALRAAETPYTLAVTLRNRRYDAGRAEILSVDVPVVSVGNLTLGGTGKTPFVAWLARWFRRHGVRVSIVSRGYGAEDGAPNDEALELEERLPDVPHLQNVDRAAAARIAVEELETELVILDDGFQHRRLARQLDIVLLDALCPWGYNHVFPRGTLREPLAGLRRAQVVALSRSELIESNQREAIRSRALRYAPQAVWVETTHRPAEWIGRGESPQPIDSLRGRRVAAFCGLGNPAGFRRTLAQCGVEVSAFREFADHHAYSRQDVESLAEWAARSQADAVVCTHKDLVKIGLSQLAGRPLWALAIDLTVLSGEAELAAVLGRLLPNSNPPTA